MPICMVVPPSASTPGGGGGNSKSRKKSIEKNKAEGQTPGSGTETHKILQARWRDNEKSRIGGIVQKVPIATHKMDRAGGQSQLDEGLVMAVPAGRQSRIGTRIGRCLAKRQNLGQQRLLLRG